VEGKGEPVAGYTNGIADDGTTPITCSTALHGVLTVLERPAAAGGRSTGDGNCVTAQLNRKRVHEKPAGWSAQLYGRGAGADGQDGRVRTLRQSCNGICRSHGCHGKCSHENQGQK